MTFAPTVACVSCLNVMDVEPERENLGREITCDSCGATLICYFEAKTVDWDWAKKVEGEWVL